MREGWLDEEYWIVLDETEAAAATEAYGIADCLPGFLLLAVRGWDDFVVRDGTGQCFQVPSVPLTSRHLQPMSADLDALVLAPDESFTGKIKWYVTPLVFGGDPEADDNLTWVDMPTHQGLVRWWNDKYREAAGPQA